MDVSSLVDTYVATGQKIDVLWNFFVTVHIAIAGLLFVARDHKKIHFVSILVMLLGYCFFSLINYSAKEIEYGLLNAITQQIKEIDTGYQYFDMYFEDLDFSNRSMRNIFIHIGAAISLVVVSFLSGFTVVKKRKAMFE